MLLIHLGWCNNFIAIESLLSALKQTNYRCRELTIAFFCSLSTLSSIWSVHTSIQGKELLDLGMNLYRIQEQLAAHELNIAIAPHPKAALTCNRRRNAGSDPCETR